MHAQPSPGLHEHDEDQQAQLQAVLSRIADHDEQALGCFYDLTLSSIYGLILRVVRNPADAEEVVGDVYLQVWEKARDFRSERGCVLAWLKTLAWSRAVDRQRRGRKYAMEVELHPEGTEPAYMECEGRNAEAALMAWSSADAVARAFQVLSDIQKQILTLAFHQDMSHQDIAQQTGLPLGTVKSHARRGLAALRTALGGGSSDDV
ncbi:MAG: sigma-70 family RNA polymerase sigma factor [Gammaproteobacteria bacterium]|nr:sigma-70 family RNA polymerase sigma factor [Gammaproteobacteria bacterium]